MKKISTKPKLLDVRNVMKKTACKRFLITLNHFRSRRCTLFFHSAHFFNSQHSSAPDRDQSWPRSGIFRNLPNFDRLYLRAQMDFFQNFWFFLKLRPSSRRYVDLEGLLVHLSQSASSIVATTKPKIRFHIPSLIPLKWKSLGCAAGGIRV